MRFQFSGNCEFCSMELTFDSQTEQHMLEAFRSSTLPHVVIEKSANGLKITRRSVPAPTEDGANTA